MRRFSVFLALPSATLRIMASRQLVVCYMGGILSFKEFPNGRTACAICPGSAQSRSVQPQLIGLCAKEPGFMVACQYECTPGLQAPTLFVAAVAAW